MPRPAPGQQPEKQTSRRLTAAAACWLALVTGCAAPPTAPISGSDPPRHPLPASTPVSTLDTADRCETTGTAEADFSEPAYSAEFPGVHPASGTVAATDRASDDGMVHAVDWVQTTIPPEPLQGWSLDQLRQLALQHNPAIRQAAASASRSEGNFRQSGLRPNPSVVYFGDEIGNDGSAGLHGAYVSQTFVTGNKLEWNRQVTGFDVQARRWDIEVQRHRVLTDIQTHFYEALAAQRRLELTREFRSVAAEGAELAKRSFEASYSPKADVLQSEIQLSETDLAIRRAELELRAAWSRLTAVAGLPDLAMGTLSGDLAAPPLETDPEGIAESILARSPQMAAALFRVRRAQSNLQRQQVQNIPNLDAQLGAGRDESSGDTFARVQLTLPLPVHNQNQGNIQAAWAEYCEATQNVQRVRMQVRRDLAVVLRDFDSAEATVDRYENDILPKIQETLKLMQQATAAGEYNFLRVLTVRRDYLDANLNYVRALGDRAIAHARIDGLLLTDGLSTVTEDPAGNGLRGQALSQQ